MQSKQRPYKHFTEDDTDEFMTQSHTKNVPDKRESTSVNDDFDDSYLNGEPTVLIAGNTAGLLSNFIAIDKRCLNKGSRISAASNPYIKSFNVKKNSDGPQTAHSSADLDANARFSKPIGDPVTDHMLPRSSSNAA